MRGLAVGYLRAMKWGFGPSTLTGILFATTIALAQNAAVTRPDQFVADRSRLPEALQHVPLNRLSSGALMLLDRGGNLVRPPAPRQQVTAQPQVTTDAVVPALDSRVGANIRLGDDPPALPNGLRAQAEPHIARSPVNPNLLFGVFQEGRFSDGGAVDCGFAMSVDGGTSWSRALVPNLTLVSGGPYYRATDPVAAVDPNGVLYVNTLVSTDPNGFNTGAIVLSRSTDGGNSFGTPSVIYQPPIRGPFPDKPWMAVNTFPGTPTFGRILATFTLFAGDENGGGVIYRAFSDNGGVSWSAAQPISSVATNAQGSQPVFLPNGTAAIVYWSFGTNARPGERVEAAISTDGGVTFANTKRITLATEYVERVIRSGTFLPSAVADRTIGGIYVVYQTRLAGNPKIAFTKSTDGGVTWSSPIAISDNPAGSGVFNPAINVSPDGQRLTVCFYDHRDNPGSDVLVNLYLAQSFNGGATWEPNIRVSSATTNASLAPLTEEGFMLGDYLGIAESPNVGVPAVPLWVDTRTGNPDPFVARVTITPSAPTPTPTPTPTVTPAPTPSATPILRVSAAPIIVNEGGDAMFTITASNSNPTQPVTVQYVMAGTAQSGADYTLGGTFGQVTIPAGATSATVTLHALTDSVPERGEKAILMLTPSTAYRLARPRKANIKIINVPVAQRRERDTSTM